MAKKEIQILKEQIDKLDNKGFDLEAWKIFTIGLTERIFGSNSHKIEQIKALKHDFSSWSLRDTSGSHDSIKKKAKVILESAISEIEQFGLPDMKKNEAPTNLIAEILKDELKGSEYKRIEKIINEDENEQVKSQHLTELLNDMDSKTKDQIILNLMRQI
jgi:DNA primase